MTFSNFCNLLLSRHTDPYFISDISNYEIIYQNPAMKKLLLTSVVINQNHDPIGEKFYTVIYNEPRIIDDNFRFDWELQDTYEHIIFDKRLNQKFSISHIKVSISDNDYLLSRYKPDINSNSIATYSFETAVSQCISALQNTGEEKINALLKILGEYYDADSSRLYYFDTKKTVKSRLVHWFRSDTVERNTVLDSFIDEQELRQWCDQRNEVGIIEYSKKLKSYDVNSKSGKILLKYGVDDVAMSIIEDINNEPIALVSVSNRENPNSDLRLLQAISSFIEQEITKSDIKYSVQQINEIDVLTGFFSRVAYSQKVDEFSTNPPKCVGVVFANINGLKTINTEFGYAKGDSYIKKTAEYIGDYFKSNFYRISGDEFISFICDIEHDEFEELVLGLYQKMNDENDSSFALGYSYGSGRSGIDRLIKEADTMMYINKQEYYHSSNRNFSDITDNTLSDLLSYLANDEFMIYLQPQVHLSDSSLHGAEALIRRYDKTNQKMVFPDQFISLYEKKSVIRHVDIFVLEQVCTLLAKWGKIGKAIPISVNFSRVTLQEYGIVDTIAKICDKYHVPRDLLVIEVTERVGLIENNVASSLIMEFKDRGFKISLDDFGCAYSNIVTLAQIEVDEVKIDKSLIDDLTTNRKNHILVKNVLSMCNDLDNTDTLAEGIEYVEQGELLHELGCKLGQGYFYSRPIPVDEFCDKYI